jgi:hypothetical protein
MTTTLRTIRRLAYRTGSVLGDVQAVSSGNPRKIASRFLIRKPAWRAASRILRRLP